MTAITLNSARNPITPLMKRAAEAPCRSYLGDQQAQGKNLQRERFTRHQHGQVHLFP